MIKIENDDGEIVCEVVQVKNIFKFKTEGITYNYKQKINAFYLAVLYSEEYLKYTEGKVN